MILDQLTDLELESDGPIMFKLCEAIRELSDKEIESPTVGSFIKWAHSMVRTNKEKSNGENQCLDTPFN